MRVRAWIGIVAAGAIVAACGLDVVGQASSTSPVPPAEGGLAGDDASPLPPADGGGSLRQPDGGAPDTGAPDTGAPDTGAPDTGASCPTGWTAGLGHCYLASDAAAKEPAAETACAAAGGHLVTIGSQPEQSFVAGVGGNVERWIGLTASGNPNNQPSNYQWVTAEPMSFTAWAIGQPNENGACGTMLGVAPHGWDDHPCTDSYGSICEID